MYIMSLVDNEFSYTWFFYLGIVLFFIHIALYGLELHISYFSLIHSFENMFKCIFKFFIAFIQVLHKEEIPEL